jgi:pimeloyl-ACP methyl ester carboxylesterase
LLASLTLQATPVQSRLVQIAPARVDQKPARSEGQTRAVVLIHGFVMHFRSATVPQPRFRDWQRPGCLLVKRLAREADVYAFAYGQNVPLDEIVKRSSLRADVAGLRRLGYKEIILVGHSAGGLVARHFVEDNPDAGVTRVIQVCTPNCGTPTAKSRVTRAQQPFLDSLTEEARQACLKARQGKRIPESVDFVCLLANGKNMCSSDGVVPCASQWSEDLRRQCIPVVVMGLSHREPMRSERGAEALARLVHDKQPRWQADRVQQVYRELISK